MRNKYGYEGPNQYRPISPWGYIGYTLVFLIPILGFFMLLGFTFSKTNINRRNFARSYWCILLLGVVIVFIVAMLSTAGVIENNWTWLGSLENAPVFSSLLPSSNNHASRQNTNLADVPSGVSPEFYEAMVEYEEFFDKYVEFMKKYETSSNPVTMALDYANYLSQYATTMQKIDAIDESKLTKQENAYFTEVMLRINRKLAGVL